LEVGVLDGTHGWLRVRAELGADGVVSASLTASASAHESLRAVLPEMANYLESEAVGVSKLAVHRTAEGAPAMAANTGEGQGTGNAQSQRQDGRQEREGAAASSSNASADQLEIVAAAASGGVLHGPQNGSATERMASSPSVGAPLGSVSAIRYQLGLGAGSNGSWLNVCA
jgi:hypothetical protein